MADATIPQQDIQNLIEYLADKSRTFAVFTFDASLRLLQQAVLGVVGNLTLDRATFNPAAIETSAASYLELFYTAVIRPAEIANIPGGIVLEPAIHALYTAVAGAAIKTTVQLVFRETVAASANGFESTAPTTKLSSQLIELSLA